MTLKYLKKRKNELLKEIAGYERVLNSPILKLTDKQKFIYKNLVKDCQDELNEVENLMLKTRKRWA